MSESTAPAPRVWTDAELRKPRRLCALYSREDTGELLASVEQDRHLSCLWHISIPSNLGSIVLQVVGDLTRAKARVEEMFSKARSAAPPAEAPLPETPLSIQ